MDVTEEGYIAVATGCRQLQTLRMYACAHVNNAVLQACGELLPGLRVLDICGAHMVTDDGAKVSHHLPLPICQVLVKLGTCANLGTSAKRGSHAKGTSTCSLEANVALLTSSIVLVPSIKTPLFSRINSLSVDPFKIWFASVEAACLLASRNWHGTNDWVLSLMPSSCGSNSKMTQWRLPVANTVYPNTLLVVQTLGHCHKLEVVNFTWCVQLTDEGVCPLAAGCTQLQSLSLHGLRGITNRTIEALAKHCRKSLHTLDVHGCIGINTGEGSMQAYLQRELPHIQQFVIHT